MEELWRIKEKVREDGWRSSVGVGCRMGEVGAGWRRSGWRSGWRMEDKWVGKWLKDGW